MNPLIFWWQGSVATGPTPEADIIVRCVADDTVVVPYQDDVVVRIPPDQDVVIS